MFNALDFNCFLFYLYNQGVSNFYLIVFNFRSFFVPLRPGIDTDGPFGRFGFCFLATGSCDMTSGYG